MEDNYKLNLKTLYPDSDEITFEAGIGGCVISVITDSYIDNIENDTMDGDVCDYMNWYSHRIVAEERELFFYLLSCVSENKNVYELDYEEINELKNNMAKKIMTIIPLSSIIDDEEKAKSIGLKVTDYKNDCFIIQQNLNGTEYMFHLLRLNEDKWFAVSIIKQSFDEIDEQTGLFKEKWNKVSINEIISNLPIQLSLEF